MAKSSTALLISALLLATLAATASAMPAAALTDVNTACDHVQDPKLCSALVEKHGPKTIHELAKLSVDEAVATAENAIKTADSSADSATDPKMKQALEVCSKTFAEAVQNLKKASTDMGEKVGSGYDGLVNDVTGALTFVGACDDAFGEDPDVKFPVADDTATLKNLVGNSLTLSVALLVQENAAAEGTAAGAGAAEGESTTPAAESESTTPDA